MRLMSRLAAVTLLTLAALAPAAAQRIPTETATFAGGCFWCTETDFDKVPGVVSTTSGYTGGKTPNPTYEKIARGDTGHTEAVRIEFDPKKVTYAELVEIFWRTHDLLDATGQFCDRGSQYRPAIFTHSDEQAKIAAESKKKLTDSGRFKQPIATELVAASIFTPAEDHHQDFAKKKPGHYFSYRAGCGRDARLKGLWGAEAGGKIATQ